MIVVGKGKLYRMGYEKHGAQVPGLCYQVRNLAGVPVTADYTGPGADRMAAQERNASDAS